MKKRAITIALAMLVVLPAMAHGAQFFSGLMGPSGSAATASYTSHTYSQISGTYVAGRYYRAGFLISCCSGGSFYSGSAYTADSNMTYNDSVTSARGYCSRSSDGSGSSTITCYTD